MQFLAGGTLLAQDDNILLSPEGTFAMSTVEFSTGAGHAQLGQALAIRLLKLNAPNAGIEVDFDDVRLNMTAIPGPAAGALSALGALLIGLRRRFRKVRAT